MAPLYTIKTNKYGLPVKVISASGNPYQETTYNKFRKNGSLSWSKYVSDGSYVYRKYDNHSNEKYTEFSYPNHSGEQYYTLKLDKKGNPVSVKTNDGYSETTTRLKYSYDRHGNIKKITETVYRGGQTNTYVTTIKYKKFKVSKKHLKYLKYFKKTNIRRVTPD